MWDKIQKLLDRFESRWALYLLVTGSGFVTGWASWATDWLNALGPIAWVSAAMSGAAATSLIFSLVTWGWTRWLIGREVRSAIRDTGTNPLEKEFDRKTIKVWEFYSREYIPHVEKRFARCRVVGPGNIVLTEHIRMVGCVFRHCQIVIHNGGPLFGVTAFESCSFESCVMENLTFMMNTEVYRQLGADWWDNMPTINLIAATPAPTPTQPTK